MLGFGHFTKFNPTRRFQKDSPLGRVSRGARATFYDLLWLAQWKPGEFRGFVWHDAFDGFPSERRLSEVLGIRRTTMLRDLDELKTHDLIKMEARLGSETVIEIVAYDVWLDGRNGEQGDE